MTKKIITIILLFFIASGINAQVQNADKIGQEWKTDTINKSIELDNLKALLKRNQITPINEPKFWTKSEVKTPYFDEEAVMVVEIKGEAKAFPISILMFHEIVNLTIGDIPVSVTYCPLCNTTLVFDRRISFEEKDYVLTLGTSGMLRKSNLIMWDEETETWWQQLTGEAIVGKMTGTTLKALPSLRISLKDFFDRYPDGQVLSIETGFEKQAKRYGTNPYKKYDDINIKQPRLFFETVDTRLPAMERTFNLHGDSTIVYPLSVVEKLKVINDKIDNTNIVLFYKKGMKSMLDEPNPKESKDIGTGTMFDANVDGKLLTFTKNKNLFVDKETKSVWDISGLCVEGKYKGNSLKPLAYGMHFAFAWFSFYPNSKVYKQ